MPKTTKRSRKAPTLGDTGITRAMGSPSRSAGGLGKNPSAPKSTKMSDVGVTMKKPRGVSDVGVTKKKATVKDVMSSKSKPRNLKDV